jgi:hypothetical protein
VRERERERERDTCDVLVLNPRPCLIHGAVFGSPVAMHAYLEPAYTAHAHTYTHVRVCVYACPHADVVGI